ncbi:hypothetical protein GGX14DRAFT_455073 [Mycena pura]|uniref:DH domain-containing protein n=1 Tax=Mycena pura TaxID=153505 RepID=A0AAD6YDW8_9AGAR|nr:hypothetical protein GGX14DRAFT_455073 [Mycena pura]
MPLPRVSTSSRSKSRSPLPASPRPPTFLPPSHYAVAGGLSPRPLAARKDSLTSSLDNHSPLESRRNSVFMPISSNSDSSFEFCQKADTKRSSSGSKGGGKNAGSSRSKKCESHMMNLPLVEAHLLPSLRDTIDRMTRPPSRLHPSPPSPPNDSNMNDHSLESFTSAQTSVEAHTMADPPYSISPPPPSAHKPLKSALRAPAPKLQLRPSRSPASVTPVTSPGLRPPLSTVNANLDSSGVNNDIADAFVPSVPKRGRPRSRTDPGAQLCDPVDSPPAFNPTPKSFLRSGTNSLANSGIPRLRAVSGLRSASSTPRPRQQEVANDDSASDFEMRFELAARDRRSLCVVNGVVSSESESDGEARVGVGLGLGLDAPYAPRSFASKLRSRFTGSNTGAQHDMDEAAERRRKELLGLVKGLEKFGSRKQTRSEDNSDCGSDPGYGVAVSGSGRVDFGAATAQTEPPRVMVSSSSGAPGELDRDGCIGKEQDRSSRLSFWKRSPIPSPALPAPPQEQHAQDNRAKRSPSRSPVIPHTPRPASNFDVRADLMPESLRRHSAYRCPPPPVSSLHPHESGLAGDGEYNVVTYSPESIYEEEWPQEPLHMQPLDSSSTAYLQAHDRLSRLQRQSDDLANSDAVLLALNSRLAAAREREAFGIPPSSSDGGYRGERMSFMDSGSSLARVGMLWEDEDGRRSSRGAGVLSLGAEKLFRTLSGRTVEVSGEKDVWGGDIRYSGQAFSQDDISNGQMGDVARPFSQSLSDPSIYDDDEEDAAESHHSRESWRSVEPVLEDKDTNNRGSPIEEPTKDAWRSTFSPTTYASIVDRYDPLEIRRQETIHTLCVSEEAFVARLANTTNLFILPLRMQDSKYYVSGVPAEIGKLFDWLEDILNLHTELLSALRRVRETQHPVVERFAETIQETFVKRLEVYQPYLARLVNVARTIACLVADTTSDFGEFVRIQESVDDCRGWSLEALLVDPVTRLGSYPALFRKLQEYTPKSHVDFVPTFALLHSTEMIIKVMTEVKIREDEYDLVKSISQRIKGLPSSASLARRGRRLLCQGQLIRMDSKQTGGTQPTPREAALSGDRWNLSATENPSKRSSKLNDAIHDWGQRRGRSGSERSEVASFRSYSTNSSAASTEPPLTPSSPRSLFYSTPSKPSPSGLSTPQGRHYPIDLADNRFKDTQSVQVFVFSDCIVVATACKARHAGPEEWRLLDKIGIARVLDVTEISNETDSTVFALYSNLVLTFVSQILRYWWWTSCRPTSRTWKNLVSQKVLLSSSYIFVYQPRLRRQQRTFTRPGSLLFRNLQTQRCGPCQFIEATLLFVRLSTWAGTILNCQ